MTTQQLQIEARDGALHVTFNRPEARNAMTWEMYERLAEACNQVDVDPGLRALVLRGSGGEAFIAGTDIAQFRGFTGTDGVAYENRIDEVLTRLAGVKKPVIAVIDGHCVGGGLAIASCADIRIGAPNASFSVPIAKTLGNTLSIATLRRLIRGLGEARVKSMLLLARRIGAQEALDCGFLVEVEETINDAAERITKRVCTGAPLTHWSIKENIRRLHASTPDTDDSDVVETVYGSRDFAQAVEAFFSKHQVHWAGK